MGLLKKIFNTEIFNDKKSKIAKSDKSSKDLIVIRDFCACVNGEMNLSRGQKATLIYEADDWFFVESARGIKGFVPRSYFRGHGEVTKVSNYNSQIYFACEFEEDVYMEACQLDDDNTFSAHYNKITRLNSIGSEDFNKSLYGDGSTTMNSSFDESTEDYNGISHIDCEMSRISASLLNDESQIEYFV